MLPFIPRTWWDGTSLNLASDHLLRTSCFGRKDIIALDQNDLAHSCFTADIICTLCAEGMLGHPNTYPPASVCAPTISTPAALLASDNATGCAPDNVQVSKGGDWDLSAPSSLAGASGVPKKGQLGSRGSVASSSCSSLLGALRLASIAEERLPNKDPALVRIHASNELSAPIAARSFLVQHAMPCSWVVMQMHYLCKNLIRQMSHMRNAMGACTCLNADVRTAACGKVRHDKHAGSSQRLRKGLWIAGC